MTLWHRPKREVYRVYDTQEYLAGTQEYHLAEEELHPTSEVPLRPSNQQEEPRSASGRLLGLGVLIGVSLGVLGLVASHMSHRSAVVPRPALAHRHAVDLPSRVAAGPAHKASRISPRASGLNRRASRILTEFPPPTWAPTRSAVRADAGLPGRGESSERQAPSVYLTMPEQVAGSRSSAADVGVSPIVDEFGFER